ncbi:hypothetical protein PPERSA_03258 [Pseudocohnilembus persalinus]|uniref:PAS domain n=1 Tax=Pseudocohnilembus persalinus TaxID=266149 RepID=A0A0V0QZ09_PSEPJ|nr:hypothetical protein PPERSA_03258 [Pseudocohnilembus persalinus]|eukprot:KRX07425.1 hypothetical protein PPERSA_03258 [Pseudocohnilembus persalinus]
MKVTKFYTIATIAYWWAMTVVAIWIQQIAELYKRDSGKESTMITNLSISEGNLVSLVVSIAKQKGKIISQISPKVAQFFGYSLQEFQNIQNINVLMPEFLKNIHDDILENMINRSQASPKSKGFQSILKNQKIIDVKNLYQNCFVQFMVPQLLKVFQNIQFSEEDFTSRIYEKQLISYQSSRIKIPNNFEVIKQEYDNTQISQRDTSVSGNSKFQSFKKSFASGATSRRIREVKLDLLDKECNQKTLNYLYNNQNIYSPNNIICDFACKMDLFLYNIITGSQNENNTVYFLMEVKELIPYTVARQQNSNRISSQRTQELRGQSFLGTMYMESQGGRSQTINQQKNSSIFNNSETNININDLTASQMIAKNLVPIEPPIEYNNISNYNNEEKKQKNKKVNPTIKELSQEDNVASNENNANNGEKGQKYKQGEQIKVFVKETDEEKNNVQKQNQYNIPDITQNQNDISSNQDILGLNSVNESTSRNLLNQIEINVDQSNNFQSQYNKAKNEYKYQNYLEDYHQTQNQQQKFGETSFNQPQISDVDVTINDQSKMMDFTPRNKDTEDKNISLPGSNEQNEQNQQFHQNSNSDQQQEYIDVESHINQNRNDTILEEDNKNLLFNEFEERVEEKNNQNHDNYEDQLTNSGDEGNNNYDSKMSAELQSIEKYYKKENENEIYEEDTDEEKEIINPNYNSRQSKKSLKTVKDFLSKKKIPTANNDNNKKPGIYQGQHSISSSNSLRGQFNINILSDLFGKEKRPQSLKQFEQ